MKKYVTENGREHGLINSLQNSSEDNDFKHFSPEHKAKMVALKKEEGKIKKVTYLHKDGVGNFLAKPYCHFAGEPLQQYLFLHGYEYEVPLGLINEVNAIKPIVRSDVLDANGMPTINDKKSDPLHRFVSMSF